MGAYGCRSTEGQKNKERTDKNDHLGHDFGPMVREISPDIMFCQKAKKHVGSTPDGCVWVSMGAGGCMYM